MFEPPTQPQADDLFEASLPSATCTACGQHIARRHHRVKIRASWRNLNDTLCPGCWNTVCQWAARFALAQGILPGID